MTNKTLIVTCALPYANGSIHLGHLVEHIQADIWVRFKNMQGITCYFICADDTHGTPIMLKAEEQGITPLQMITDVAKEHIHDFAGFNISFSHYYTTHSSESKELVHDIYNKLVTADKIETKVINQLFDEEKQIFLPDRFIKGTCPKCKAPDQYGDNCEVCGTTYLATELINPYSTISGSTPVTKESLHFFFKLSECQQFLQEWVNNNNHVQHDAKNKMNEWLDAGLENWDISRDKPYFGFEIPGHTDKYFYVWLDAPIGYLGSFWHFCKIQDLDFASIINNPNTEMYHFIGKDILYFHALFWPAVLNYANYKMPSSIFVHGFLTVNGQKMSKSRGTFILASKYLESGLDPNYFRYYIATKSSNNIEDIDLSINDFVNKVNSELIGKYINIAARSATFLSKYFANKLADLTTESALTRKIQQAQDDISNLYHNREYSKALKLIMNLTDETNLYIDSNKPWAIAKDPNRHQELHQICSVLINAFRLISIYLKPIIPTIVSNVEDFLAIKELTWLDLNSLLTNHQINPYTHLLSRIDEAKTTNLITV